MNFVLLSSRAHRRLRANADLVAGIARDVDGILAHAFSRRGS